MAKVAAELTKGELARLEKAKEQAAAKAQEPDADGFTPQHWAVLTARGLDKKSLRAVAEELGITVSRVAQLLQEGTKLLDRLPPETLAQRRAFEVQLLDEIQHVHMGPMRAGDKGSAKLLLDVSRRRDRLLGLSPRPDELGDHGHDGENDVPIWTSLDEETALGGGDGDDEKLAADLERALRADDA